MKRLLGLLVLLTVFAHGAYTVSAQTQTKSDSVGLEGTITKAPPTQSGSITLPSNGQVFSQSPISVSGLCPLETLVKVFKNNVFAGSVQCNNGSFSLSVDLFSGANELIVKVYDDLDQAGPDSNIVTVTYNDAGLGSSRSRVTLTTSFAKRGTNPNEKLTWPITLSGGIAPYALSIDWGDGSNELLSRSSAGQFEISHIYKQAGTYNLIIKATDSNGASAFLQVVAIANGLASQDNTSNSAGNVVKTEYVWWPIVIAGVFVLLSYWLGRRAKLHDLKRSASRRSLE